MKTKENAVLIGFDSISEIFDQFNIPADEQLRLADAELLFAEYDTPSYEGSATVIYRLNGKLYSVHGSHCSCYGLEGQWDPEESSIESLSGESSAGNEALRAILGSI